MQDGRTRSGCWKFRQGFLLPSAAAQEAAGITGGLGPGLPEPAGSTPVIQKPGGVSASGLSHSRSCRPHDSVLSPRAVLPAASGAFMRAAGLQGSGPEGRGSLPCRSLSRGLKTSGSADFPAVPRPQPAASAASGRFSPCVEWSCLIRRIRSIADILLSPCSVSLLAQQSRDSGPGFSLPWIFSGLIGKTGILFFDLPEKPGGCRAPGDAAAASCRIILLQTPRLLISNAARSAGAAAGVAQPWPWQGCRTVLFSLPAFCRPAGLQAVKKEQAGRMPACSIPDFIRPISGFSASS